jgi:hypothetical protein
MKKSLLLTTLLAAGITQVQAAPFAQAFTDGSQKREPSHLLFLVIAQEKLPVMYPE